MGDDRRPTTLTRREAIVRVSAMLGGASLISQSALLAGCSHPDAEAAQQIRAGEGLFSAEDVALLDEIADTILPETDTPGARAALVGPFIALMVSDTYYDEDRENFREGLKMIDSLARENFGGRFLSLSAAQRLELLEAIDAEQHASGGNGPNGKRHYFRMMKELALLGYFTSEIGYTQAMRYEETPGRYVPCADYEPGDRAWADHA